MISEDGPEHAKEFKMEAVLNGKSLGIGIGSSKKKAEQAAARFSLENQSAWMQERDAT